MLTRNHEAILYRFTPEQIKQAAQDIGDARKFIVPDVQGPLFIHPGRDIVGAISHVVGPSRGGAFNSRAVIAESIIMNYLGMHPYTWEDELTVRFPEPTPMHYPMDTHAGMRAYDEARMRVPVRRAEHTVAVMDSIVEWLKSDIFTGGTHGPAADSEEANPQSDRDWSRNGWGNPSSQDSPGA